MKILAVGGGSGGHVTPIVAVFKELQKVKEKNELHFWCDKKFGPQAKKIVHQYDDSIKISTIVSGKLRRYHHLSFVQHLLTPSVVFPNIIDFFKVIFGTAQSLIKLVVLRPNVIFAKGGYVCLPVGYAAKLLNIPLVIHDSDAHPGLTNRMLAPYATYIGTGAPLDNYSYPKNKTFYVGIPVSSDFKKSDSKSIAKIKQDLGFSPNKPLVVITGGGLGAKRINDAIVRDVDKITAYSSLLLISGVGQYDELRKEVGEDTDMFHLVSFVSEGMAEILSAAEVVVARAGATSILELAALGAPTILVPNARLTGGHQLKNAKVYASAGAVEIVDEDEIIERSDPLTNLILDLIADKSRRESLSKKFSRFSKPNAAHDMADLILKAARGE